MSPRTPTQEVKYLQALGYAWGRKDATPCASTLTQDTLKTGSQEFATFYSQYEEKVGTHLSLESAWAYFSTLSYDEQQAYYVTWRQEPANA
jgi:hypothetical protein